MKKNNNKNKFKIGALVALLMGGLGLGGVACNPGNTSDKKSANGTTKKLTIEQMQDYVNNADTVLTQLKNQIDSPDTNPDARFHARQAYKQISKERAVMARRLKDAQAKTIRFKDAQRSK